MGDDTKQLFKHLFAGNTQLWAIAVLLFVTSAVIIFSAIAQRAYGHPVNYLIPYERHVIHILIGFTTMWCAQAFSYRRWRKSWWVIGFIALAGLLYIIFLMATKHGDEINGAIRAFRIGPVDFQPNEVAKFALILFLSDQLTLYQEDHQMSWKRYFTWLGVIGVICLPIALQNLSTSLILFATCLIMLYVGRVPMKYLWTTAGLLTVLATLLVGLFLILPADKLPGRAGTHKNRIERFVSKFSSSDEQQPLVFNDENRQIMNCKVAVANGKTPSGPGNSHRREFMQLPYSDCVFAVAVEEWGWWAVAWLILLYMWLYIQSGRLAHKCHYLLLTRGIRC